MRTRHRMDLGSQRRAPSKASPRCHGPMGRWTGFRTATATPTASARTRMWSTWSPTRTTAATSPVGSTKPAPGRGAVAWRSASRPPRRSCPSTATTPTSPARRRRACCSGSPTSSGRTFTGIEQAAWTVENTSDYVVAGGEFPRVGDMAQYGLVRFAKKGVAGNPNNTGGAVQRSGGQPDRHLSGAGRGPGDLADELRPRQRVPHLPVMRNGATGSPVKQAGRSGRTQWDRPVPELPRHRPSARARGRRTGSSATDPDGNEVRSNSVSTTVAGSGPATDGYARSCWRIGPMHYWRMSESSGTALSNLHGA